MTHLSGRRRLLSLIVAGCFLWAGCTKTLVKDDVRTATTSGNHCSGSEWVDDSAIAALPIPFVAFFVPHIDLHDIKADEYLKRCGGDPTRLVNRTVEVNRNACIPAALVYIITLGIWQWCPAHVSWEADLKAA